MRVNVLTPAGNQTATSRPVIFLHGIGAAATTWTGVMDQLASGSDTSDLRLAAIDLMGHGESPVPDDPAEYTRDRALDDIDELIASMNVSDDHRPILVGWSLGGYLALAHAATRVLGESALAAGGIIVLNTGPGFRDPEKREAWNERSRRNAHRFGVVPQAAELNLQHDSVVMDNVGTMTVPTIVLAGSEDRPEYLGAGQYLERKMANARCISLEGGGHAMHEETHATEVAAIIAALVADLDQE